MEATNKEDNVEPHILKRFLLHKKIGKGAYGVVYKAIDKKTKETVALKKLYGAFRDDTDAQRTFREVMLLQELNGHDNIIRLLNVIKAENDVDLYLVFEHMEADLYNVIRAGILQEVHKRFIIYQVLKSLKFIHSGDIIHRDLKPSNIFINSDCQIKLGDFGLARTLTSGKSQIKGIITDYVATRWYRAPEMLMGSSKYTKSIDMWSVGCIFYELLSARPLFPGKSTKHMFNLVLEVTGLPDKTEFYEIKKKYELLTDYNMFEKFQKKTMKSLIGAYTKDQVTWDFMNKLLVFNPDKRMTVEEALEHELVADFHKDEEEIVCEKKITIPMDDNQKFSLDEYRTKLYDEIFKRKMEIRKKLIESIKNK
jgi:mitogen-activated protein kinase 15